MHMMQNESRRHYRAAIVALRDSNWEEAVHHLLHTHALEPNYQDTAFVLASLEQNQTEIYQRLKREFEATEDDWLLSSLRSSSPDQAQDMASQEVEALSASHAQSMPLAQESEPDPLSQISRLPDTGVSAAVASPPLLAGLIDRYPISQRQGRPVSSFAEEDTGQRNIIRFRAVGLVAAFIPLLLYRLLTGSWMLSSQSLILFMVVFVSSLLLLQGLFTVVWMLYTWDDPKGAASNRSPEVFREPSYSFSALIPARKEAQVIRDTIRAVTEIDYPEQLREALILCRVDDAETIQCVGEAIEEFGQQSNIRLVLFAGHPTNKPYALNKGLAAATNDVVCVFDAEDEPHPDLYSVINTMMLNEHVDVIQSGVQLMNLRSRWFSALNVLEYYFWFKSGLHFFTRVGKVTPLGGNTVFCKRAYLNRIDGWDVNCLTEDADLGLRLVLAGARVRIVYDEHHATREETPPSVAGFIKQRTRWNQGFLQVFFKGDWQRLPRLRQQLLMTYILLQPLLQALLVMYIPVSIVVWLTVRLPVGWALFSWMPFGMLFLQLAVSLIGLFDFIHHYRLKIPFWFPFLVALVHYPYQLMLMISAFRALYRVARAENGWEKTLHVNAHRADEITVQRAMKGT